MVSEPEGCLEEPALLGDVSESLSEPPFEADLPGLTSFLGLCEDRLLPRDMDKDLSSSTLDIVVAANEELLRENLVSVLSPVTVESVYVDVRLATVLERRLPFVDPPKSSPTPAPERPLKRLREMASRPNIAALERVDAAVGVPGLESCPVWNLKRPN